MQLNPRVGVHSKTLVRQDAEVDWDGHWWKGWHRSEASCCAEVPGLLSSARNTSFHGSYFGTIQTLVHRYLFLRIVHL